MLKSEYTSQEQSISYSPPISQTGAEQSGGEIRSEEAGPLLFPSADSTVKDVLERSAIQRDNLWLCNGPGDDYGGQAVLMEQQNPPIEKVSRKRRVLLFDNQETRRNDLAALLRQKNYYVASVATEEEAWYHLKREHYHVIILDDTNTHGLEMLRKLRGSGWNESIKAVLLATTGTRELMRVAFREYKVVDYLTRHDYAKRAFLRCLDEIFSRDIKINLDLIISWQSPRDALEAVNGLHIAQSQDAAPGALQLAAEVEDLLCRLFDSAESILVHEMAPGWSGSRVLRIQPFYADGCGPAVIVKFGNRQQIEEEYARYKDYVEPAVKGRMISTALNICCGQHIAGIMYSLLGAIHGPLESFGSFYHHATVEQVATLLESFFKDTCGFWYANMGYLLPRDLTKDYKELFALQWQNLYQLVSKRIPSVREDKRLRFKALNSDRTFVHPLVAATRFRLVYPTFVCTTHGDCNQNNLLIDSTGHTWMIDFQHTGKGHILRDIAMLDSVVRFQLLMSDDATLTERLSMEESLCGIERFSEVGQLPKRFVTTNQPLMKAYMMVVWLRTYAQQLVSHNPDDDIREYYAALFYNALSFLRFDSMSLRQCEHALLSASLLAEKLGMTE